MNDELLAVDLTDAPAVFDARQAARDIAERAGFEMQDQVRIATAVSEIGREIVGCGRGSVQFVLDAPTFLIRFSLDRTGSEAQVHESAIAAQRLLGSENVSFDRQAGVVRLTLRRLLPERSPLRDRAAAMAFREALRSGRTTGPLDDLREQNAHLIDTLERLNEQKAQLLAINDELEETNHGVMAMYAQLTDELETTNRGVVALYAELEDKSEQLAIASQAKSRFLANASHELRTPINSILGVTQLLGGGEPLTDTQRYELGLVESSARDLLRLVDELLDIGKAEAGAIRPDVAAVDVGAAVAEVVATLAPVARADVALEVSTGDVGTVETDATLLAHVLRNLVANALSFTTEGSVTVTTRRASLGAGAAAVEIEVRDTGVGIDPAEHDHIFEEFYQVPGPLQADRRGSGLGLAYCRRLAEALHGTLGVDSAVGRGSAFVLRLPAAWAGVGSSDGAAPPGAGELVGGPPGLEVAQAPSVVLIASDDVASRSAIRGQLQGLVRRVVETRLGDDATTQARRVRPHLVLLDVADTVGGPATGEAFALDPDLHEVVLVLLSPSAPEEPSVDERGRIVVRRSSLDHGRLAHLLAQVGRAREGEHDG